MIDGKPTEHHLIEQREDSRVGADAEPERQHRNQGESRTAREEPKSMTKIPHRRLQPGQPTAIAAGFLGQLQAAGFQKRGAAGLVRRHSEADIVLNLHLDVDLKLLRQLTVSGSFFKQTR